MSDIMNELNTIREARYGKEVRESIAAGIETCYKEGKAGTTDLQARQDLLTKASKKELDVERKRLDKLDSTKANKTDLTSPYNFKVSCLSSVLPESGNTVNDTYYCTDLKYRKTWNGSAWKQSSLNEADYEDELTKTNGKVSSLKEDLGIILKPIDILTNNIVCGYNRNGQGSEQVISLTPARGISKIFIKIKSTDVIKLYANPTLKQRVSAEIYDDNLSLILDESSLWTNGGETTITGHSGYITFYFKNSDDSDVTEEDFLQNCSITLFTDREIEIENVYYDKRISGNYENVNLIDVEHFILSDFKKVKPNQKVKLSCNIAGTNKNDNITGLAGFKTKDLSSFVGWIFSNATNGVYTDTTILYSDMDITIPNGVNYVCASSNINGSTGWATVPNYMIRVDEEQQNENVGAKFYILGASKYSEKCMLMKCYDGTAILLDTGGKFDSTYHQTEICNKIKALTDKIDYVILTHYHSDHVENLPAIAEVVDVSNAIIFLPPTPDTSKLDENTLSMYNMIMSFINKNSLKTITPIEHNIFYLGGAKFDFWNTEHTKYYAESNFDYNNCSLCFNVEFGNYSFCFTGDIGKSAQTKNIGNVKKCNVFDAQHHGADLTSWGNFNPEFAETVSPDIVIGQLGTDFESYYPNSDIYKWSIENKIPFYWTGINNNMVIQVDEFGYSSLGYYKRGINN